jgi:hypothetical protein
MKRKESERGRRKGRRGKQGRREFARLYLEKNFHKKGLVEWLKVYVLSSSPSTAKQNKTQKQKSLNY